MATGVILHEEVCQLLVKTRQDRVVLKSDGTTGQATGQPKPVNWPFACPIVIG